MSKITCATAPSVSKGQRCGDQCSSVRIQVRVELGHGHRIGPGKVALLEAIGETGSITAGGRRLGMSYRRAWLLVSALNQIFSEPLVETAAGGAHGGGARLTELGTRVVAAYRALEQVTDAAALEQFATFEVRPPSPSPDFTP